MVAVKYWLRHQIIVFVFLKLPFLSAIERNGLTTQLPILSQTFINFFLITD